MKLTAKWVEAEIYQGVLQRGVIVDFGLLFASVSQSASGKSMPTVIVMHL